MNYYLILGLGLGWAEQQSKQSEICYDKVSIMFKISLSATILSYINLCHMQVHLSRNNVPVVKLPPNHTSPPSMAATFLAICLMVVLQPSGYSVFHDRDTPIQLGLP